MGWKTESNDKHPEADEPQTDSFCLGDKDLFKHAAICIVSNIQLYGQGQILKIISVSAKSEFVFSIKTTMEILKVEL